MIWRRAKVLTDPVPDHSTLSKSRSGDAVEVSAVGDASAAASTAPMARHLDAGMGDATRDDALEQTAGEVAVPEAAVTAGRAALLAGYTALLTAAMELVRAWPRRRPTAGSRSG